MIWALHTPLVTADSLPDSNRPISFVTCPVYRDTDAGRKSGCWLAKDLATGVQYDVTAAPLKPILGKEILVEGVVSPADSELCGGVVLQPVYVSVLDTPCPQHLIPAEGFPGRRFVLPARTLQPLADPLPPPPPPYESRNYTIFFELNSDFIVYQHSDFVIEDVVRYALASKPKSIVVTGYADTKGVDVSGRHLQESLDIAKARAAMVVEALTRLAVPKSIIKVEWQDGAVLDPDAMAGLPQSSRRRATIELKL
jgi:hypothetical protein